MQRLLAQASWVLYIASQDVPSVQPQSRLQALMARLKNKFFGPEHSLLVVIEDGHPLVADYACALIQTSLKKLSWERYGQWLFMTVQTHDKPQLDELKDKFIEISNRHTPSRHRNELERVGEQGRVS